MATDFDFRIREPRAELRPYVRQLWYARGRVPYERESILPTTSVVMILNLGDGFVLTVEGDELTLEDAWVIGRQEAAMTNEPLGETYMVGVSFSGWGAYPYFGIPLTNLNNRVVRLATLDAPALALRPELARLEDPEAQLQLLERHLASAFADAPQSRLASVADRLLEFESVRTLADDLKVSRKHLGSLFKRWVGTTPKRASRIARFNAMLADLDPDDPNLSQLALQHGYYDQAHLNRDFREIAGCTPTEYVRRRRHAYGEVEPGEETIFVPE